MDINEQNNAVQEAADKTVNRSEQKASGSKEPKENGSLAKSVLEYVFSIGLAVAIALLINSFILLNATIPSGSMENTIQKGDRVFGFRLAYINSEPERGDVVIFKYPDDESTNFIKRVIGLPGETVEIKSGKVYIDGTLLNETYLKETPYDRDFGPYEVPEGHYFMLGDNRNNSKDSRYWENTFVASDKILAKAVLRYWKGFKLFKSPTY